MAEEDKLRSYMYSWNKYKRSYDNESYPEFKTLGDIYLRLVDAIKRTRIDPDRPRSHAAQSNFNRGVDPIREELVDELENLEDKKIITEAHKEHFLDKLKRKLNIYRSTLNLRGKYINNTRKRNRSRSRNRNNLNLNLFESLGGERKNRTRKQKGGMQSIININGTDYQGADILLLNSWIDPATGVRQQYLVLFQDVKRGRLPSLGLAGGRCDTSHGGQIENTASSELNEESRKSVDINSHIFEYMTRLNKFVDYPGDRNGLPGRRRCFVCFVPYISTTKFNNNKVIMDGNPGRWPPGGAFTEKEAMIRIRPDILDATIIAGDDGRARNINQDGVDYHIEGIVMKAYIEAVKNNLINEPCDLRQRIKEQSSKGKGCHTEETDRHGIMSDVYV